MFRASNIRLIRRFQHHVPFIWDAETGALSSFSFKLLLLSLGLSTPFEESACVYVGNTGAFLSNPSHMAIDLSVLVRIAGVLSN